MGWRTLYPLAGATALIPLAAWLAADERPGGAPAPSREFVQVGAGGGRVGSTSCSNRGCHGRVAPPGTEGSEYNTWAGQDPHSTAYLALFDCRSERIQRQLHRPRPDSEYVPPYADALCMGCHGRPDTPLAMDVSGINCDAADSLAPAIGPSGVGCEDCHGDAGPWLDVHYLEGWRDRFPEAAAAMQPLRPTLERAEVCLRCHVGDGLDRQVNHDLIAAGHPRLNFELTSYSDRMPQHWDGSITDAKRLDDGQPARDPAGEWAVGQLATLRAALNLLAERASPPEATSPAPWPEFTEYACFSCHHALVDEGLHYSRSSPVPGSPEWGSWVAALARHLVERADATLVGPFDSIERLMAHPLPEGGRVAELASTLATTLGARLGSFDEGEFSRDDLRSLLAAIAEEPGRFESATSDWDAAAQLYLAMRALVRSDAGAIVDGGRASGEEIARLRGQFESLERIREALAFPEEHVDSPGPRGEPDPWSEDPRPVVNAIRELLDELTSGGEPPRP